MSTDLTATIAEVLRLSEESCPTLATMMRLQQAAPLLARRLRDALRVVEGARPYAEQCGCAKDDCPACTELRDALAVFDGYHEPLPQDVRDAMAEVRQMRDGEKEGAK